MTEPLATINPISKIKANNRRLAEIDQERNIHLIRAVAWQIAKDAGMDKPEQAMAEAEQAIRRAEEHMR